MKSITKLIGVLALILAVGFVAVPRLSTAQDQPTLVDWVIALINIHWIDPSAHPFSVTERSEVFPCPPANSCTQTVACEAGEVLTGGGFKLNDPGQGVVDIWESHPDLGRNRWRVSTFNPEAVTIEFGVYAMCAVGSG